LGKYKKASIVALWLYFVISTFVTFHEYPSVLEGRELYLGSKVVLQIWLLGICIWYPMNPYGLWPNVAVGIHVVVANMHGQYFSPWYAFSYVEMILAYSFLFPVPRRAFNILLVLGTSAFLMVSVYRYEDVFKWMYESQPLDLITTIVSAAVVAWMCHNFFTADRTYRQELVRKFGIIGVQAATIVHDIKSMLAAPRLYTDLLKQKIPQDDPELGLLVDGLEKQLLNINRAVTGLNQVVALQDQKKEEFSIRDIVGEVGETLSLQSRNIELQTRGDLRMISEKALVKSILFNIMMNAIHAFRRNKIANPVIRVFCDEDAFVISDNAGGFPEEILKSIANYRFDSFDGTGMGLFLVWNGVQTLGGRVYFSNGIDGAQIKISVPPKLQAQARKTLGYFLRPL
jgi:signal transduction histidine kinase